MAVYTAEAVKANVRVRDGKRVFYLAAGDHLTPAAKDWLHQDGVEILPMAQHAAEKGEGMTHLRSDQLVPKTDPRIAFRGWLDRLQAEILLCGPSPELREILEVTRQIMRCDVLGEPLTLEKVCGLTEAELRERSHNPIKYYGQPHFMPDFSDSPGLLQLNRLRTVVRQTELAGWCAIPDRTDLLQMLNRLSSLVWILMIRRKKEEAHGRPIGSAH